MTKTNDNKRQYRDSLQFPASEAENLCSFNTRLAEVTYYLIIINIAIFLVYGIDKWKAKKSLWRIRDQLQFGVKYTFDYLDITHL